MVYLLEFWKIGSIFVVEVDIYKRIKTLLIMIYLKEDGSLDVERISNLPIEEKLDVIGKFTRLQQREYFSHFPINESNRHIKPAKLNYTLEDLLARGGATHEQVMNKIRKICEEE